MLKLDRKLLRDLVQLRGQATAIALVIAAGVATFVMSMCAYRSLELTKDDFYREHRFADVFAQAKRAPNAIVARLKEIPGVTTVQSRLVFDVLLDVPGMSEPATARLISIAESDQNQLNAVYVSRGRMLDTQRTGEVVISEVFADAHGFVPGDKIHAIINGRSQVLSIVGVGLSPEYVIQVQPGSIMPDNKRFGIFWVSRRELEAAQDMTGAFNSVVLRLSGQSHQQAVIDQIDRLLEPFGSVGAFGREDQLSHQFLSDELAQLRGMAWMVPSIFLSVAAFLLNIAISRIIAQQREQIAALKAFGYSNYEIGVHYLNFVLVIALVGNLLGTSIGLWMGSGMMSAYAEFYKFPDLKLRIDWFAVAAGVVITVLSSVAGTVLAVRRAVRLPPAEAMRPEPPASYHPSAIERILPRRWLPPEVRMVVRNITRRPIKSLLSILGIAMAVAVMILGNFTLDAMNYMMHFQFRLAQRQDLSVTFVEPATASVMHEVRNLDGVLAAETTRSVASRIGHQNRTQRVGLLGLQSDAKLFRLLDANENVVRVPEHGIMLNTKLASLLNVERGDWVIVEVLEGRRPTLNLEVSALVEEYAGVNAYMNKHRLHATLLESNVASGAFLKVDPNRIDEVFEALEERPGVASVTIKEATLQAFEATVAENLLVMRSFIVMFAGVIAVGVVYNSARISLSERSRDLATMRVVGFTHGEVSIVLLGEMVAFTTASIPLGWLIGYGLAAATAAGIDTDNYRLPLVVSRETFIMSALVVVVATVLSAIVMQRRVGKLDLIEVLKTRE